MSKPWEEILEGAYAKTEQQKKNALINTALHTLSWGTKHVDALASIRNSLRSAKKLAFSKQDQVIRMYKDASEALWASLVIPTKKGNLSKPLEKQ